MLVLLGRWTVLPLFLYTYSCEILVCVSQFQFSLLGHSVSKVPSFWVITSACVLWLSIVFETTVCSDKPGLRSCHSIIYCFLFQHDGPIPNDNHKDVSFLVRVRLRRVDSVSRCINWCEQTDVKTTAILIKFCFALFSFLSRTTFTNNE